MTLDVARNRFGSLCEHADGRIVFEPSFDLGRRLAEGDPTYGWLGDPTLGLVRNLIWRDDQGRQVGRWEVWATRGSETILLCSLPYAERLPTDKLLRHLAAHDGRTHDVLEEVNAHNDALERSCDREFRAEIADKADRLGHALGRDLGVIRAGQVLAGYGEQRRERFTSNEGQKARDGIDRMNAREARIRSRRRKSAVRNRRSER